MAALNLPVIDFTSTELKPGTPVWETAKSQVKKAAEEYGCFEVLLKNIPQKLRKAMDGALEESFALPLEIKKRIVSEKPYEGYNVDLSSPTVLWREGIGLRNADDFDKVQNFTNILWPQGNINYSKTVHFFTKNLSELSQMIRKMIVESFGLEKYLDEHMNCSYNAFAMSRYEAPESIEKRAGLNTHTDKTMTTIVYQNQVDGLEVQTKDGQWIAVNFSPHSLIVIIGECLSAWTNGRLCSPPHRVMMSGNRTRYSAFLFTVPKADYMIKAVEELVDEEHPMQFKPFKYSEYLVRRSGEAEAGKYVDAPLKAYFSA